MITHDLSFATPDTNFVGVWLGIDLANRLNVTIDDKIRLYSLKDVGSGLTGFTPKVMPCMVTGIVETGMSTYDDNFVYMPLDKAQELFELGSAVTTIEVKTTDFYNAWKVARNIAETIGLKYSATDWKDYNRNLFSWMTLEKWMMFLVLMLFVLVAAIKYRRPSYNDGPGQTHRYRHPYGNRAYRKTELRRFSRFRD